MTNLTLLTVTVVFQGGVENKDARESTSSVAARLNDTESGKAVIVHRRHSKKNKAVCGAFVSMPVEFYVVLVQRRLVRLQMQRSGMRARRSVHL